MKHIYVFAVILSQNIFADCTILTTLETQNDCTSLANDETFLVFSTLKGSLIALDKLTGGIRWTNEEEPLIKAEHNSNDPMPPFVPNPKDGSLYIFNKTGDLKKLPLTVPQLVSNSPCRSSNGYLYSGRKCDSWYIIDFKSGHLKPVMTFATEKGYENLNKLKNKNFEIAKSCSAYLSKTQYTVMMVDTLSKEENYTPWNITYYFYSSHNMNPDILSDYNYIHLCAPSSGKVVTLNKQGRLIWKNDLGSPIISVFLLGKNGLISVPFTTLADNVLQHFFTNSEHAILNEIKLLQSIFVGEFSHGLYVLPSLIDENTVRYTTNPNIKLIDGPTIKQNCDLTLKSIYSNKNLEFNHCDLKLCQQKEMLKLEIESEKQNGGISLLSICLKANQIISNIFMSSEEKLGLLKYSNLLFGNSYALCIFLTIVILILIILWYEKFIKTKKIDKLDSPNFNQDNVRIKHLPHLENSEVQIGKITFNTKELLGKGCEGTFVFRGSFEKRNVAVKRILPECFSFADREVALLRESDRHKNVVRYFCTEQDQQFRYIALELCAATLQEFTENLNLMKECLNVDLFQILQQATSGLSHLHSLNIVHRDIKPQNVLLSFPDSNNEVRALISDFGLCKQLKLGKSSFSHESGITGTEGWIAPEIMFGKRATIAVDIFSLGCVFFYVLTGGYHVFGDSLRRQSNILMNKFNFSKLISLNNNYLLKSKLILAEQLISDMIHSQSEKRPDAVSVSYHPLFWKDEKILDFLLNVSDRVEKLRPEMEPLTYLEVNSNCIVAEDWISHLEIEILKDLKNYRSYNGKSVRDLLRALRNKKHHFHELSPDVQKHLGTIPKEFTNYWLRKFPYLLQHVYHSLSSCSKENHFRNFYSQIYLFSKPNYLKKQEDASIFQKEPYINKNRLFNLKNNINKRSLSQKKSNKNLFWKN